jgi:hypothetical protein
VAIEPEVSGGLHVEQYSFAKDKLPKSLSHPLKRSLLDAALRSCSVYSTLSSVHYLGRSYENFLLDAHFSPEQYGYASSGKVWVRVFAVPAAERKLSEGLLLSQGLSVLCRWLANGQSEGNAWRGFAHA